MAYSQMSLWSSQRTASANDPALDKLRCLDSAVCNGVDERERKMLIGKGWATFEFNQVLRSHCQVTVLELELVGLRKAADFR